MITYPCPHCGERLTADDTRAGHELVCSLCGETTTVPGENVEQRVPLPETVQAARPTDTVTAETPEVVVPMFSRVVCPGCRSNLTLDPPKPPGVSVTCGVCGTELTLQAPDMKQQAIEEGSFTAGGIIGGVIGFIVGAIMGCLVGLLFGPLGMLIGAIVFGGLCAQGGVLLFGLLGLGTAKLAGRARRR